MKSVSLKALAVAVASVVSLSTAQAAGVFGDGWNAPNKLFEKYLSADATKHGWGSWRIPAITTTTQGTIIAMVDKRFTNTDGNTDIFGNGKIQKVWFNYKVSHDGGRTWTEAFELKPPTFDENANTAGNIYKNYISDPQIVHNPETGTTFAFGYQSGTGLTTNNPYDVFMFKSEDGGVTWNEGESIKNSVKLGTGFTKFLQGPGKGMYYKGTLYVPIQKFGPQTGSSGSYVSSSGFIYSTDNGETWQQSNWVINNSSDVTNGIDKNGNAVSSESSIFHHTENGVEYIYLAGKRDPFNNDKTNRMVWRTKDNGQTWESVVEDFIPHNVVGCQSSTLALTDHIYFVGYSVGSGYNRNEMYLTTNKGRRVKLYDRADWNNVSSNGYSSITSDLDNIYVLYEGGIGTPSSSEVVGSILLQNFDYAGKEYANLNARLLRSSKDLNYIQNTIMDVKDNYVRGSFGDESQYGAEAVFVTDKVKLAVFHKNSKDLGDDVYRTIAYDDASTSLIIESSNLLFDGNNNLSDSLFGGYQYSAVDYANGADDEVHSLIAGYALNLNTDILNYQFKINGKMSKHDLTRNSSEGLGKNAEFDSKVISITNELSKSFEISGNQLQARPFVGLDSTYFEHDGFSEQNGNGFNDITVHSSDNWSHGLYVGAELSGTYALNHGMSLDYSAKARYVRELSDIDNWTDSYTVFDTDFTFAAPVDKNDQENTFDASASVILNVNERVGFGIGANIDTANENVFFGQAKIKF